MSDNSHIQWTDSTWNVISGCTKVSPGCDHCYIERTPPFRMAHRKFDGQGVGATTGVVFHSDRLDLPFRWRKPRRVFVNSLADLFHDDVPDAFIARVFAVMAAAPRHTFQVLTKRHARMRSLLQSERFVDAVVDAVLDRDAADPPSRLYPIELRERWWPLANVWIGVSVESQQWADIRVPALLDTPAAVRFLSCEPLLGPVDLSAWLLCSSCSGRAWVDDENFQPEYHERNRPRSPGAGRIPCGLCNLGGWDVDDVDRPSVDWCIVGGESGPNARPMHPQWARDLRDQCVAAGVPFFFKQWGESRPLQAGDHIPDRRIMHVNRDETGYPSFQLRVGKKAAGRELDGRTWDEYPESCGE